MVSIRDETENSLVKLNHNFLHLPLKEVEKEVKNFMVFYQRLNVSDDQFFNGDVVSESSKCTGKLFDSATNNKFKVDDGLAKSEENVVDEKSQKTKNALLKLRVVELDFISIPPTFVPNQHIINLRQSFTFPFASKPSREIATQTSQMNLMSCYDQRPTKRPASLPPENVALTNLEKRIEEPKKLPEPIGDGFNVYQLAYEKSKSELELPDCIPHSGVQEILVKSK
jgi:hypothetical protein